MKKAIRIAAALVLLATIASHASATTQYLAVIGDFVRELTRSMKILGNSIAVIMFMYGAAKYVYTSDDPGGRKQGMGICIAAIVAFLLIQIAEPIINAI